VFSEFGLFCKFAYLSLEKQFEVEQKKKKKIPWDELTLEFSLAAMYKVTNSYQFPSFVS
jgi:hypothetical protein